MEIWSTADGSGAITVYWDYTKLVQTAQRLCGASDCLYTSADPGFMAPPTDPPPAPGLYRLADGTNVGIQIVSIDAGLSMNNINGAKLSQPGDAQLLGTMPSIHVHPTWQIFVPPTEFGNYVVRYKLTTNSPGYTDSQVYTQTVTNVQPSDPTPTVTPTVAPTSRCTGDCDGNGVVTVDELLTCVSLALSGDASACGACDSSRDGTVTVDEIVAAARSVLSGCPPPAPATLQMVQDTIFTPRCAIPACHDATTSIEGLNLTAGAAHGQLVNVPSVESQLLLVDPGNPDNSFLVVKVEGPPPLGEGTIMPQTGLPLSTEQIQLIRQWVLQGAMP